VVEVGGGIGYVVDVVVVGGEFGYMVEVVVEGCVGLVLHLVERRFLSLLLLAKDVDGGTVALQAWLALCLCAASELRRTGLLPAFS
jgi:hypothetical protein